MVNEVSMVLLSSTVISTTNSSVILHTTGVAVVVSGGLSGGLINAVLKFLNCAALPFLFFDATMDVSRPSITVFYYLPGSNAVALHPTPTPIPNFWRSSASQFVYLSSFYPRPCRFEFFSSSDWFVWAIHDCPLG